MHCHSPHRFNPPPDDAVHGDDSTQHAPSSAALARIAFRFARKQLAQLASVFGLRDTDVLCCAAAPALLATAKPAEAAHAMHGLHALDGPIAIEAASVVQAVNSAVREEVLLRAPCSVAAQVLLQAAPLTTWPPPNDASNGEVAQVAQAASQCWARRGADEVTACEAQHEGLLSCVRDGWPWFAAASTAVGVLADAADSTADQQPGSSGASGNSAPVATAAEQAMHMVHVVDRYVSQLEGVDDLRRGVAAAAALHAAVAPSSPLWQRAVLPSRSRKGSKNPTTAADLAGPALAGTLRTILRLVSACMRTCGTLRQESLDDGQQALTAAVALLHTALMSAQAGSHAAIMVTMLPPLATLLGAATEYLRCRLTMLPCAVMWPEAKRSTDHPAAALRRILLEASAADPAASESQAPVAAGAHVTGGHWFERSAAGAARAAAVAVEALDACVALAYDACDRCVQLRDGAGEAMDAVDARRVAVAAGICPLPRALGHQAHCHATVHKLLDHSAVSQQQRHELLAASCAALAARVHVTPQGRCTAAVKSLTALAESCGCPAGAAQGAPDSSLPHPAFSAAATMLACMPHMHAASGSPQSDLRHGATGASPAGHETHAAHAGVPAELLPRADVSATLVAEWTAERRLDTDTGALLATLLQNVPDHVSDAHVAVHTAEMAAFVALPHARPAVGPLWRLLMQRRAAPAADGPTPHISDEQGAMLAAVLADLAATATTVDPAATAAPLAHAATAALLRMLRTAATREAVRALITAAQEDEELVHSVELGTLSALLSAFSGTTDSDPPDLPDTADLSPLPSPAMDPPSEDAWALCMSQWLLSHPCLSHTPLRHLRITASHSPRLSAAVLPLALAAAACSPDNADPGSPNLAASYDHLHAEFSDLLSAHLLPSLTESSAILQHAPQIAQEASQLPGSASMHAGRGAPPRATAELTAAPHGVLRLVLRCLAALRTCYCSARVHRYTRVTRVKPQVELVCGWDSEAWVNVDYLQVAAACLAVGSPRAALQYLELWAGALTQHAQFPTAAQVATATAAAAGDSAGSSANGSAAGGGPWAGLVVQKEEALLWATLRMLRDPDTTHGLASVPKEPVLLALADLQGQWPQALQLHAHRLHSLVATGGGSAGQARQAAAAAAAGVHRCLTYMGCGGLLRDLQSPMHTTRVLPSIGRATGTTASDRSTQHGLQLGLTAAATAANSVGAWDAMQDAAPASGGAADDPMHAALAAVTAGALPAALEAARHGRAAIVAAACRRGVGDTWELRSLQVRLQAADAAMATIQGLLDLPTGAGSPEAVAQVVAHAWRELLDSAFMQQHPRAACGVHDLHTALLRAVCAPVDTLTSATAAHAAALRKCGSVAAAMHHHLDLHALLAAVPGGGGSEDGGNVEGSAIVAWRVEEAKLLWASGRQQLAVKLAEELQGDLGSVPPEDAERAASVVALAAKWSHQQRSKPSTAIMDSLTRAVDLVRSAPPRFVAQRASRTLSGRVHFRMARFADRQHKAALAHVQSVEHEARCALLKQKEQRDAELQEAWRELQRRGAVKILKDRHGGRNYVDPAHDLMHTALLSYTRSLPALKEELADAEARPLQYLQVAVRAYSDALTQSSAYDMRAMLRLVQLWLQTADAAEEAPELDEVFQKVLEAVPSHKLLYLSYQMGSRLTLQESPFQKLLWKVVTRLAVEHPHHVLLHLLCLATHASSTKQGAAQQVLQDVAGRSPALREAVAQLRVVAQGYVAIAQKVPTQEHRKGATFAQMGLGRAADAVTGKAAVPVLSLPVAPRADGVYEGLPYVAKVLPHIRFVGGVHAPKCIDVVDSHGQKHKQLVKSNDDLRQDAVMQQFFALVNHLLAADAASAARQLRMATYHAVAFSGECGLVQWVTNTMPLNEYLTGAAGAHERYRRPGEMSHADAHAAMTAAHREPGKRGARAAYDRVTAHFQPVLRHFFTERYTSPMLWLEKRRAYGRSVAVSSVAGYVIGLGDRHGSNVLLDAATAEVLHIDLGIAFEAGRLLPTPELTPFRMTRDVVDGLGVEGTNGTLRACAEHALRVLRAAHEAVVTVVEVFVHDPLRTWAPSPAVLAARQRGGAAGDSAEAAMSPDAEHAVARVTDKLRGLDWGEPEQLSVEGHVAQLLIEAVDPARLCMHFPGWAPWL
eukprot:jgi/Ulvmu1/1225/UM109_0023.1